MTSEGAPTHDAGELLNVMISQSDDGQLDPEVIDVGLSDHRLVRAYIDFTPPLPLYETRTLRVWWKFDINAFRQDLKDSILCADEDHTSADSTVLVKTLITRSCLNCWTSMLQKLRRRGVLESLMSSLTMIVVR